MGSACVGLVSTKWMEQCGRHSRNEMRRDVKTSERMDRAWLKG